MAQVSSSYSGGFSCRCPRRLHGLHHLAVHRDLERLPVRRRVLRPDARPVTVALNNLVNTSEGVKEYNVDMAAALITALPTCSFMSLAAAILCAA